MTDQIKTEEAIKFLELLDPNTDQFCFRTFDDDKNRKDGRLAKNFKGLFGAVSPKLIARNKQGAGIFVVISEGGQKKNEINRIRYIFADTDGAPLQPLLDALRPHIVVESSSGNFHCYWQVEDCKVDLFNSVQTAIAAKYGTDANVADPSRVMRLPGFFHQKASPYLTNIIEINPELTPYTVDKIIVGLALNMGSGTLKKRTKTITQRASSLSSRPSINSVLEGHVPYSKPELVGDGGRNTAVLKYVGHLRGKDTSEEDLAQLAHEFNNDKCKPPLAHTEVNDVISRYVEEDQMPVPVNSEWEEPEELQGSLLPVKQLDYAMLPDVFVPFVKDSSERMGQPPDFFAVPMMITAAAALGSNWGVCPKAQDKEWKESAVVWGGVVAPPGSKKSPCIDASTSPINEIEKQLKVQYDLELAQYQTDKIIYDKEDIKSKSSMLPPTPPVRKRAVIHDATYQVTAKLMSGSPDGLLYLRDEITGMISAWDADGQESARSFYLTAWNGSSTYNVDRIGRATDYIERAFICIVGGLQPSILEQYIAQARAGGFDNDGMLQRFQMLVYPDFDTEQEDIDRSADNNAKSAAYSAIEGLRWLDPLKIGASPLPDDNRNFLHFDDAAQNLFNKVWKDIRKREMSGLEDALMTAHLGKMPGTIAKLAMLIHLLDGGTGPITYRAIFKAVRWKSYLYKHIKRVHNMSEKGSVELAIRLGQRLKEGKLKEPFTLSDIKKKNWGGLGIDEVILKAIKTLEEENWVQEVIVEKNGRPTRRYVSNPRIRECNNF